MIDYTEELRKQLEELNLLLEEADNRLKKSWNIEEGKIRVCSSHGCPQYHFKAKGEEKERYIPTYEKDKIKALVQREYDRNIKKELESSRNKLQKFLKSYDINNIDAAYENLHQGRKSLITPIIPSQAMKIEEWYRNNPGNNNPFEKDVAFTTKRGETVRSKSEKILADAFLDYGIPYQYEPCYELANNFFEENLYNSWGYVKRKYPDFVLLNVRKDKTIYWEHLGLIGELDYATRNFEKLMDYEKNGLILGDNLIVTLETLERPLDIKVVEEKIRLFLT
ncbi:MAG: hypothetical protein II842_02975 [Butyrivibrio sp.]|nr:hypothetical protein [Butyrivibrio sp.]